MKLTIREVGTAVAVIGIFIFGMPELAPADVGGGQNRFDLTGSP